MELRSGLVLSCAREFKCRFRHYDFRDLSVISCPSSIDTEIVLCTLAMHVKGFGKGRFVSANGLQQFLITRA